MPCKPQTWPNILSFQLTWITAFSFSFFYHQQLWSPSVPPASWIKMLKTFNPVVFVVVQSQSCVWLFVTPWTAAFQASLFLTISRILPKFMFTASLMPSIHLSLWCPRLLPSIFPSVKDFSNELSVCIRWPKYWSFNFSLSPSSEYSGLISLKIDRFGLLAVQGTFRSLL